MAVLETPRPDTEVIKSLFISEEQMEEFRAITARQFEEMGIEYNPHATAADVRAMMRAEGIRAEKNLFSRGIIAAREE